MEKTLEKFIRVILGLVFGLGIYLWLGYWLIDGYTWFIVPIFGFNMMWWQLSGILYILSTMRGVSMTTNEFVKVGNSTTQDLVQLMVGKALLGPIAWLMFWIFHYITYGWIGS